jgi:hypothetical protein
MARPITLQWAASQPRAASKTGGAGRDRTGDLLNANQALSQLSYSPLLGFTNQVQETGNAPDPQPLIPDPQNVIEADWTLPAGAWPCRQSKSQNYRVENPRRTFTLD